jgi:hypothetical protein
VERSKRLTIIAGGKGGVGKSFFAQSLYAWYHSMNLRIVVFDGDPENSTTTRHTKVARPIDMRQKTQLDQLLQVISSGEATHVLLDSQAATTGVVQEWFNELDLANIEKHLGAKITVVCLITPSVDTLLQTIKWTTLFGRNVDWLAVKNLYLSPELRQWDASVLRKKFLEEFDGREVTLPAVPEFLMSTMESSGLSVAAAIRSEQISWADKQRLQKFQDSMFEQFRKTSDLLL